MAVSNNTLAKELASFGFDICHPFSPAWYNELIETENLCESLSPLPNGTRAFIIGNTRQLWPAFLTWLHTAVETMQEPPPDQGCRAIMDNPLDSYIKETIQGVLEGLNRADDDANTSSASSGKWGKYELFWSGPNSYQLVSMQRVAVASGLAYLDLSTHLAIHPTYGAWASYRAVVVFTSTKDTAALPRPALVPRLLSKEEEATAKLLMDRALAASDRSRLCQQLHGDGTEERVYLHWIALRDCVILGKEHRFSESQLLYHYTKDARYLEEELQKRDRPA